eukprot:TRINITY_DN7748_c0_g1_i2.p1 TRINITY_DN7748_c0_g1~~TRINITY_DN7748_c0_g1_i2.p1  ORF type:complete len:340 (+),score=71.15 TRINITY_DN7748_c0_g1_i2:59-1078(+)
MEYKESKVGEHDGLGGLSRKRAKDMNSTVRIDLDSQQGLEEEQTNDVAELLQTVRRLENKVDHILHILSQRPTVPYVMPPIIESVPMKRTRRAFSATLPMSTRLMIRTIACTEPLSNIWDQIIKTLQRAQDKHPSEVSETELDLTRLRSDLLGVPQEHIKEKVVEYFNTFRRSAKYHAGDSFLVHFVKNADRLGSEQLDTDCANISEPNAEEAEGHEEDEAKTGEQISNIVKRDPNLRVYWKSSLNPKYRASYTSWLKYVAMEESFDTEATFRFFIDLYMQNCHLTVSKRTRETFKMIRIELEEEIRNRTSSPKLTEEIIPDVQEFESLSKVIMSKFKS